MRKTILVLILFLAYGLTYGQERTVTGTVVDNDNIPLIGASVVVKLPAGELPIGTITDIDGNFSIKVPTSSSIFIISFIGYEVQEINYTNRSNISAKLELSSTEIDDVVVTALGIKKSKKALGYAFADVKGEALTTNRDANFINSISNKVAGVNISQTAGGAGTSSRIVIRGIKSLSTESQPLIVVDGVPLDNTSDGASWLGGVDYGNSLMGISPDDIESMSVLKGPNAAALYGSRAAMGVILITTKKGTKGDKMKVTLNSNFMFERAYITGKYQNEYGAGFGGTIQRGEITEDYYNSLLPEDQQKVIIIDTIPGETKYYAYSNYGTGSWGPRMDTDTLEILNWNDRFVKYESQPNNVNDYYEPGYTLSNSIAIENGNDKYNWRFSVGTVNNKGLKPSSEYERKTFNYMMNSKLNDYIGFSFKANYIREDAHNRAGQGDSRTGARNFIWMPRSINIHTLESDYKDENGFEQNWYPDDPWQTNPYWEAYENYNNDYKNQFIGFAKVNLNITSWLTGFVRSSMDTYTQKRYLRIANGAARAYGDGSFTEYWKNFRSLNHDFLLIANRDINDDFSISGNLGGNYYQITSENQSTTINGLAVPNFFSINNPKNPSTTRTGVTRYEKVIQSLYGSAQLVYKNWWYTEITARNDWSSTLPPQNNSYFYPSVNTSIVITDALGIDDDIFSFGKVRLSYAEVGNDTRAHQLSYQFINVAYGDNPSVYLNPYGFNPNLKPEKTKAWEVGADVRLWQNRLGIDFTYYDEMSYNQIVTAPISAPSTFTYVLTNGGTISNKGIEIQLNATPVKGAKFSWDLNINFAKNHNKIEYLSEDLGSYFPITGESQIKVVGFEGNAFGDILGVAIKKYDNPGHKNHGRPLIDADGLFVRGGTEVIGNITPDWTGGITNTLKYKNLSLIFSIGVQMGGDIFSKTNKYGLDNGQFEETLEGRDSWYSATQDEKNTGTVGYVGDGVLEDGSENSKGIDPQVYFHQRKWGGIAELDVYDASYVKLRDVTLNYNFPEHWFENIFIQSGSFSLVARNIWLIYSGVPNIDPESSFSSSNNALGQEYAAMPTTRSYGFNLRLTF